MTTETKDIKNIIADGKHTFAPSITAELVKEVSAKLIKDREKIIIDFIVTDIFNGERSTRKNTERYEFDRSRITTEDTDDEFVIRIKKRESK